MQISLVSFKLKVSKLQSIFFKCRRNFDSGIFYCYILISLPFKNATRAQTSLWFSEPNHLLLKREAPLPLLRASHLLSYLPLFTAVGPHQCDRTSAPGTQCVAGSSSRHFTASCPHSHEQHAATVSKIKADLDSTRKCAADRAPSCKNVIHDMAT